MHSFSMRTYCTSSGTIYCARVCLIIDIVESDAVLALVGVAAVTRGAARWVCSYKSCIIFVSSHPVPSLTVLLSKLADQNGAICCLVLCRCLFLLHSLPGLRR